MKLSNKEDYEKAGVEPGDLLLFGSESSILRNDIVRFVEYREDNFICYNLNDSDEELYDYEECIFIGKGLKNFEIPGHGDYCYTCGRGSKEEPKLMLEGLCFMEAMERLINFGGAIRRDVWGSVKIKKNELGKPAIYYMGFTDADRRLLNTKDLNATDWEVWAE